MGTDIPTGNNNVSLTRFGGGKEKGICYQITVTWNGKHEFARLTKEEMYAVARTFLRQEDI